MLRVRDGNGVPHRAFVTTHLQHCLIFSATAPAAPAKARRNNDNRPPPHEEWRRHHDRRLRCLHVDRLRRFLVVMLLRRRRRRCPLRRGGGGAGAGCWRSRGPALSRRNQLLPMGRQGCPRIRLRAVGEVQVAVPQLQCAVHVFQDLQESQESWWEFQR